MVGIFTNRSYGPPQSLSSHVTEEQAAAVQELLDDGDWEVRSCTLEALAGRPEPAANTIHRGYHFFGFVWHQQSKLMKQ